MIPPERRRFQTEHPRGARCPPGNWVSVYRKAPPQDEEPLTISERAQLRELQREVRDLRMKNDFLGKYATFFALRVQVLFFVLPDLWPSHLSDRPVGNDGVDPAATTPTRGSRTRLSISCLMHPRLILTHFPE